jgi:outer membrane protein OmpA-like peptidoglycan-associated protein
VVIIEKMNVMKTEELDKQLRKKIDSLNGNPPGASWDKEKTWEKLSMKTKGTNSGNWLKYAAASFTIFFVKWQNVFAGASATVKTTIVVSAVAAVSTTAIIISDSIEKTPEKNISENNAVVSKSDFSSQQTIIEHDTTIVLENVDEMPEKEKQIVIKNNKPQKIVKETNPNDVSAQPAEITKAEPAEKPSIETVKQYTVKENSEEMPVKIDISDILFKKNTNEIISKSYSELNYLLEVMKRNPEFKVLIIGYTDPKEKDEDKLSSDRGYIIYKYLTNQGVENGRISYKGYGTVTKYSSKTEEGRELNRRAEIFISK